MMSLSAIRIAHPISTLARPLPAFSLPQLAQRGRQSIGQVLQALGRILLVFLLLIGACTVFDDTIGDGPLPHFNPLRSLSPSFTIAAQYNTTLKPPANNAAAWRALSPSRELLTALSPEISAWLYTLHQNDRIVYAAPHDAYNTYHVATDTPILAAYRHLEGKLYIGPDFWALPDGKKIAVLAHEYRHSRQNAPKRICHMLAQLLGGGRLRYDSVLEDEAFAYERQAQSALGM